MTEVMKQEMEDAAAWLSTLHGEELMHEAAVPKKIVAEDFFCGGTAVLYNLIVEWMDIKAKRFAESEGSFWFFVRNSFWKLMNCFHESS